MLVDFLRIVLAASGTLLLYRYGNLGKLLS